jgi:hypothetical protein
MSAVKLDPEGHARRVSNGLKEFLEQLAGIDHTCLLDLGPVWQGTLMFFIERRFKVFTDDLLTAWGNFLSTESQVLRDLPPDAERPDNSPTACAERFLQNSLQYPAASFDAVLVWDALDYVDRAVASKLVGRLAFLLRDGGVALALFHTQKTEQFNRYRISDSDHLDLVVAHCPLPAQRCYQNREISDLFRLFRSSKTFVGRDQLRETVFIK